MDPSDVIIASAHEAGRADLAETFRTRGDRIIPVEDGLTAREAIRAAAAHYLVLDLSLPGLDAEALGRALHEESDAEVETLEAMERRHVSRALSAVGGNRSRAARVLGISRSTLLAKIRRYELD